ncbi:methyltransferase domain-containing protein [Kaistia nematophila]|uniref:Methyltransferase type 11 domain-containing protein n=1 Tax=Kaistia nematophila TaxID=2994654 RepID=A0A9X3DY48_9HYPH|nr:methyltransferase domain-containing protein [Kaistia nematophila]MCX5567586.1 hypothetical protein [Kaistia nematophila]
MTAENSTLDPYAFHMIDALWCDLHGVYVKGWAHAYFAAPTAIHLRSGESRTTATELFDRPDLQPFFPSLASTRCGFAVYLPCAPFRPVTLEVETAHGTLEFDVAGLPADHPLNSPASDAGLPVDQFIAEMKRSGGTVLEIGARAVSPLAVLNAGRFAPECKFIGLDIHKAPGVDIVGDAHFLSDHVAAGSLDGVCSYAVIEHLACPWLVAHEINKVLKIGGLTLHAVPHSFPIHEMPNDFWRMSSEGLKILFSPAMGFEVVAAGMTDPVRMLIHPSLRSGPMLDFQLHDGMANAWILARKTSDLPDDAVRWPLERAVSFEHGRAYPSHGAG